MRDFKIRQVIEYDNKPKFDVEIEFLDNGDREMFGFPLGNGWELIIDGVPKYVSSIKDSLKKRGLDQKNKKKIKKYDKIITFKEA